MDPNVNIPEWIGRREAPETKEVTNKILVTWGKMLGIEVSPLDTDLDEEPFVKEAYKIANLLRVETIKMAGGVKNLSSDAGGVYVGFPQTVVGKLNAKIGAKIWFLREHLREMEKVKEE